MIIWRGWGFLAAVLLFGGLVAAQLTAEAIGGEGAYQRNSLLLGGLGLAAGGAVTFLLARWLEGRNPPRSLVDQATGEQVVVQRRDDLFFIPMKYWGIVGIAGGLIVATMGILGVDF